MKLSTILRFWKRVDFNGPISTHRPELGPCWLWQGHLARGYGEFRVDSGRKHRPHRIAYELKIGPIPANLPLDHLCRVRNCVRPTHVEPVTCQVNIQRGLTGAASTARALLRTHCPKGHTYSGLNLYVHPNGGKVCRTCQQAARRRYTEAQNASY